MYNILRLFIIIIILIFYFLLIRKKINKITLTIGIIIAIILLFVLSLVPFERNFIGFDSVEDVVKYQYKTMLEDGPIYIIKEENSALVKFTGNTFPYLFEKEKGKWKMHNKKNENITKKAIIELGYNIAKIESKSEDKTYIILINAFEEKEIEKENKKISDSNNSEFKTMKYKTMNKNKHGVIFYTVIENDIADYKLYVDNRKIEF